jgi:predicted phage tail protein
VATVPGTPGPFVISSYTNTRVNGDADPGSNGGSPILEWQVAWGVHPTEALFTGTLNSDGSGFVSGLTPGQTYYFWNRQRNAVGWSKLSAATKIVTKDAPDAPKSPNMVRRTQTVATIAISPNYNGGSPITSYSLVWGLSPNDSNNIETQSSSPLFHLDGLDPGRTYYFWGRTSNIYGASDWSARSQFSLLAGAWVKKGTTWKRAVPYVRVGGVWVLARPHVRSAGVWKEVSD